MIYHRVTAPFLFLVVCMTLIGCEDAAEKKARQVEREKKAREEEAAKRMLQFNPGNYTPAPIDMSLERKPAATPPPGTIPTPTPAAIP